MIDYKIYLQSLEWREKRKIVIERDGGRCRLCGSKEDLHVHHRSYEFLGKKEEIYDLTTLCKTCHETFTFVIQKPHLEQKQAVVVSKPQRKSKQARKGVYRFDIKLARDRQNRVVYSEKRPVIVQKNGKFVFEKARGI